MNITRRSPLTGKTLTLSLPVSIEQMHRWQIGRELIQNAMPQLTDEQREFIMTGYTPDDWAKLFPPQEEE